MGLFSRGPGNKPQPQSESPVAALWRWWAREGESRFTAAIASGEFGGLAGELGRLVAAIHPALEWETGAGVSSRHSLVITGAGAAELRPLAERIRRAAPAATSDWQYFAARQGNPALFESRLAFGGVDIELGRTVVAVEIDADRQKLDVVLFHPAFSQLGETESNRVAFLALDWLVGEDAVERWIGTIDVALDEPQDAIPIEGFPQIVQAHAQRNPEPGWVLLDAVGASGNPHLVATLRPLRWIDHPLFDLHTEVRLAYSTGRDDGLPDAGALEELRGYENALEADLGPRGLLVAHESLDGIRTFHWYTDSEDQNARDIIDGFRRRTRAAKTHSHDPGWRDLARFA